MGNQGSPASNAGRLDIERNRTINRRRIELIRQWHLSELLEKEEVEAMVYLSITSENEIRTRSLGVEPEHASILLPAILDVERILEEHSRKSAANDSRIIPLRAI